MRHVYPACPVEPSTLRVFNWGEIHSCNSGAYFTGELPYSYIPVRNFLKVDYLQIKSGLHYEAILYYL